MRTATPQPRIRTSGLRRGLMAALLLSSGVLAMTATTGCNRALFRVDEDRTQYDRYDTSRGQFEPMFLEDEFGRRTPNLRGRLAPKG